MRIKQLGNGGGLDIETNSSFLIELDSGDYLLFDCGYNVYSLIRQMEQDGDIDIAKLKYLYISHNDDDHMGSAQALAYYLTLIKKQKFIIYSKSQDVLNHLDKVQCLYDADNKYLLNDLLFVFNITIPKFKLGGCIIEPILAVHGERECYGLVIYNGKRFFYISADTKASVRIESLVFKCVDECFPGNTPIAVEDIIMYHDYSEWDNPKLNVHACKSDFESEYSKGFVKKLIKYHNNKPFVSIWR